MTSSHPTPAPCQWFSWLAAALDRRSAPRFALVFLGAVLARGRRAIHRRPRRPTRRDRDGLLLIAIARSPDFVRTPAGPAS